MITILPYKANWPDEFRVIGKSLRTALGDLAARIDHIGSTSVPGLAAKDIIDIQITVYDLDPKVKAAHNHIGYKHLVNITQDHVPYGKTDRSDEWVKWLFNPANGQPPANVHVRISGRANQRYALLFRAYLRAHPRTAQAYGQVKSALARYHAEDIDAYYDVKDPAWDTIYNAAEDWAQAVHWSPSSTDC